DAARRKAEDRVLDLRILPDPGHVLAAADGEGARVEAQLPRRGLEVRRALEGLPDLVGPGEGGAVAALDGQAVLDLARHLLAGPTAALLPLGRLDGMVAEGRAHRRRRDLALLEGEGRLLEGGHHLAGSHRAEVAALGSGGGILRHLARELGEVLAGLCPLDDR